MRGIVTISTAVEGDTDEAVANRLLQHVGAKAGPAYGRNGKRHLRDRIQGYNNAARHAPWLVLVDLDQEAECAPNLLAAWLPARAPQLCFRVAVRAVEAWLIADGEALAAFLFVSRTRMPADPDALAQPKQTMVNLARRSGRRAVRDDMVPRVGSGRRVGPGYSSRVIEFATTHWRPRHAAGNSDSLRRAIACIERLVNTT